MVIKIFYFVVAIFSVVMIFLALQDPYFAEQFKQDINVSNMQANDVLDYEMNASGINAVYEADEVNRYSSEDEFLKFKAEILRSGLKHILSSDKAISQGDDVRFLGNVKYDNNDSLSFTSNEVIYNTKTKIARSDGSFVVTQNSDKATGESGSYDLAKKQTHIKGLKAWIEQQRR
ncbi:LPS export ABC transporter periplasmic protein LptC [Campylobacter curvus]|uniref:Lipooligosaccharide transport system, substrate-binding component (LptC family) n=1 Tax=Campylobacter curvus (strain 525.92) TaxID=360105 RepID=A7GXG4_CAMC5|nr:LPS export ABC transporter periplasmic protein LptC [Campylobacter curvus]EAU00776.1 putative lipooligosaccharide transport system, substrate-binding component (LptC family) [Campylobacter curvus 525.92]QKF60930.1 lipooligosaccharide transport system, periplasmic component LptC [Campylobacter curvus]UEB49248.1 LPS export ABC transporter periplasmic protein LptC [Campylobacter curvus]